MTREEAPTENTNTPTNTPNDLISRQAAIGACAYETIECYEARKTIRNLPSEGQNCILCEYYTEIETDDGIKGKCTRRTVSDLISRQDLIDAIPQTSADAFENCRNCKLLDRGQIIDIIESLPSAEQKTGKWVEVDCYESEKHSVTDMRCSLCGKYASIVLPHRTRCVYNFCPNCGAKMRGEEE